MRKLDPNIAEVLLEAPTYRSFIKSYLRAAGPKGRSISYSSLGLRAGFSSRAYVREMVLGKRRLTFQSFPAFARAMGLNSEWSEYFRLLLSAEEDDANIERLSKSELDLRLEKTRDRIRRRSLNSNQSRVDESLAEKLFEIKYVTQVYAALGDPQAGATLKEISQRTQLAGTLITPVLKKLRELDLIEPASRPGSFKTKKIHLVQAEMRKNKNFQALYLNALEVAKEKATRSMDSSQELFFTSSFSVDESQLVMLKQELRDVLTKFIDQSERATGNRVSTITVALY